MKNEKKSRSRGSTAVLDSVDTLRDGELQSMMQQSGWFNARLCPQEVIDEASHALASRTGRRVGEWREPEPERGILALHSPSLLALFERLEQIKLQEEQLGNAPLLPLLHEIPLGEHDHRRLYRWEIFNNVLEPFVRPIHYRIKCIGQSADKLAPTSVADSAGDGDLLFRTQNNLALSRFSDRHMDAVYALDALEKTLGAVCLRGAVRGQTLLLVMDFDTAPQFLFLIAFHIHFAEDPLSGDERTAVTTLDRKDMLVAAEEEEVVANAVERSTLHKKVRIALRGAYISYINSIYTKKQ